MERDIVYFDLETQKSFGAVGNAKEKMLVSVGVTYSSATKRYEIFTEDRIDDLITQITKADLVVGYNHLQFDYPVLQRYTVLDLESTTVNLDMMLDLAKRNGGRRMKLDHVAAGCLGVGKTAMGIEALKWWRQYKETNDQKWLMKIAAYCTHDVKATMGVHLYGVEHGEVQVDDGNGALNVIPVDWSKY